MRSHPRIRRFAKWTGAVICVLTLTAWVISYSYGANISIGKYAIIDLDHKYIRLGINRSGSDFQYFWMDRQPRNLAFVRYESWDSVELRRGFKGLFGWPQFSKRRIKYVVFSCVDIPYWLIISVSVLLPYVSLPRRRIKPGHCAHCGYNLTGNISGICSECGMKRPADHASAKIG